MTSPLWCPADVFPPRPSSARWCRCAPPSGAKGTTPSRPPWSCAITARRTRSWPRDRRGNRYHRCRSRPWSPPAPRIKPQIIRMSTGRTPDVFHGQFSPDTVGLWTFRVDGWGDPIATWRKGVTAKLDAGQSETELSNDLLVGARLLERAITGVPRKLRDPLDRGRGSAAQAGRPVHPRGRGAVRGGRRVARAVSAARPDHPRRAIRRLGGPPGGPLQRVVRDVPAVYRRLGQEGQAGARHVRHRDEGAAPHRQDGLRRGVPATDPPDRQGAPQGPKQLRHRRAEGRRFAMGDRQRTRAATTLCTRSSARSRTSTTS